MRRKTGSQNLFFREAFPRDADAPVAALQNDNSATPSGQLFSPHTGSPHTWTLFERLSLARGNADRNLGRFQSLRAICFQKLSPHSWP